MEANKVIDYTIFRFAAPPCCATTWVIKAAAEAGLGEGSKAHVHTPHAGGPQASLRVSTVRHPCDWLLSYWSALRGGMCGASCVDRFATISKQSISFDHFVRLYLDKLPGAVGEMFVAYHADSYLRVDLLPWAFVELLESANVPRNLRRRAGRLPRQNANNSRSGWNPSLRDRVKQAEREMMEHFDYF